MLSGPDDIIVIDDSYSVIGYLEVARVKFALCV